MKLDMLLDADGDIPEGEDLPCVEDSAGVAQLVRNLWATVEGECFANEAEGIPWLPTAAIAQGDSLLGNRFNRARTVSILRRKTLAVYGVTAVSLKVEFDTKTRALDVSGAVDTIFGETVSVAITRGL